jgi:hypothetical protein
MAQCAGHAVSADGPKKEVSGRELGSLSSVVRLDLRRDLRRQAETPEPRVFKAERKADQKKGKPSFTKQFIHLGVLREYRWMSA